MYPMIPLYLLFNSRSRSAPNVSTPDHLEPPRMYYTSHAWANNAKVAEYPVSDSTRPLQCVDKSTLGYASVFTLSKDLSLHGKQYSWLSSLFYFGYLVFEWPTTLLSQKFPIGRYIGVTIILWGGILLATAGAHNFAGMAVLRFILGGFESLITPTFVIINGMFYTRREQVLRTDSLELPKDRPRRYQDMVLKGVNESEDTNCMGSARQYSLHSRLQFEGTMTRQLYALVGQYSLHNRLQFEGTMIRQLYALIGQYLVHNRLQPRGQ
ncbi:hypothetical protein DFH09DRAFT_1094096 [Mycena vulgaris]|nr:hypothetical protein DFH09DRAFT_1094096 [Mycena vulgaris]